MDWRNFTREEVDILTAKPQPPEDRSPRVCPGCNKPVIRHYYRDFKASGSPIPSGTSWFWCDHCRAFASFTGPTLANDYHYDDPLSDQFESIDSANLLDHLNMAWDSHVLPQQFTKKS